MSTTPVTELPQKSKTELRKEKVAMIRKFHEAAFKANGVPDAYFDCKSKSIKDPVGQIGFFKSQLDQPTDIYFELTDFSLGIMDAKRTLYVLRHNPNYLSDARYFFKEDTPAGPQYYVDIKNCEVVNVPHDEVVFVTDDSPKPGDDLSEDKLTLRDRVCIDLKVPESSKQWINELIRKSK